MSGIVRRMFYSLLFYYSILLSIIHVENVYLVATSTVCVNVIVSKLHRCLFFMLSQDSAINWGIHKRLRHPIRNFHFEVLFSIFFQLLGISRLRYIGRLINQVYVYICFQRVLNFISFLGTSSERFANRRSFTMKDIAVVHN